jgi:hypothetical protein
MDASYNKPSAVKPMSDTIKGGGSGDGSGPTSSSRSYPKGSKVSMTADFNPMNDRKRGGTDWAVGGV